MPVSSSTSQELAVVSRIMLEMQRELRQLTFRAVNNESVTPLQPDSIKIRRVREQAQEGEEGGAQEQLPGMLIVPPNVIRSPAEAGENCTDEVFYSIAVQIIDTHLDDEGGLHTYLAWQQKVARHFRRTQLESRVFDDCGWVYFGHAEQVVTIDERMFNRHRHCVGAVIVTFIAEEP